MGQNLEKAKRGVKDWWESEDDILVGRRPHRDGGDANADRVLEERRDGGVHVRLRQPMEGFVAKPLVDVGSSVDREVLDRLEFRWYHSLHPSEARDAAGRMGVIEAGGEMWRFLHMISPGESPTFVPGPDNVGRRLLVCCFAAAREGETDDGSETPLATAVSEPVLSGPRAAELIPRTMVSAPDVKTLLSSLDDRNPARCHRRLTVASYNTLADLYAGVDQFHYAEPWMLWWDYRRERLWQEVAALADEHDCDLLCFQECQADHFVNYWKVRFAEIGFDGVFVKRARGPDTAHLSEAEAEEVWSGTGWDGCAIFYRTEKLVLRHYKTIDFNELAYAATEKTALRRRLKRDNVAIAALFQFRDAPEDEVDGDGYAYGDDGFDDGDDGDVRSGAAEGVAADPSLSTTRSGSGDESSDDLGGVAEVDGVGSSGSEGAAFLLPLDEGADAMRMAGDDEPMIVELKPVKPVNAAASTAEAPGAVSGKRPEVETALSDVVCVVNTHLFWNPRFADVKLWQAQALSNAIGAYLDEFEVVDSADGGSAGGGESAEGEGSEDAARRAFAYNPSAGETEADRFLAGTPGSQAIPTLLCGDFNSTGSSAVYQLLAEGKVSPAHPDIFVGHGKSLYTSLPSHNIRTPLAWLSAYAAVMGSEPPATNYTQSFTDTLDYIWFRNASVTGALGLVPGEYLGVSAESGGNGALPNARYSSDHVSIAARFLVVSPRLRTVLPLRPRP